MRQSSTTYTKRSAVTVAGSMAMLLLAATTARTAEAVKDVPRKLGQHDEVSGLHAVDYESTEEEHERERQLKGGGSEINVDGLVETQDCATFGGVQGQRDFMNTEEACMTEGGCSDGCCRVYNWLVCDTSNSMWRMQCVCNDNTRPRGSYQGTTVTQNGLTSPWEGPGSPLPEALSNIGAGVGGGSGNGPVSSAQAAPGGSTSGKKGKSKSSKSKQVGSTGSSVSSSFNAPGESPYVSPNGALAGPVVINPAPGAPEPAPASTTVTPPASAPAPGTSGNNGASGGGNNGASVGGVTVQSANENPGSGTSQSNSNAAGAAAGTPPEPQVAPDACAEGSVYWDMPAFENRYTQCTGTDNACDVGIGECCLSNFCFCGKPGQSGILSKCVPPYDYNTLMNNQF